MRWLPISIGFTPKRRALSVVAVAALLTTGAAFAADSGLSIGQPKLLPPDQAFRFSARALSPQMIEARFDVANGYYLYRDKLRFSADGNAPKLLEAQLPAGERKHDEFFGDVETYRGALLVQVPVSNGAPGQSVVLKAESQGCADVGICYPPTVQQVRLSLPAAGAGPGPRVEAPVARKGLFD